MDISEESKIQLTIKSNLDDTFLSKPWVYLDLISCKEEFIEKVSEVVESVADQQEVNCANLEVSITDYDFIPSEFLCKYTTTAPYYILKAGFWRFKKAMEKSRISTAAFAAGHDLGINIVDIDERYEGEWSSRIDFVKQLLQYTGITFNCESQPISINWEVAVDTLIQDSVEQDGFYFRGS